MRYARTALVFVSAVMIGSCDGGGSANDAECGRFRTALSIRDRMSQGASVFNPGEPIELALEITNTTNSPATLTAGSSCTAVVFEVTGPDEERRWGNADGIACIQMLQPRTYAPFETVTESATWDQKDAGGTQVPPGRYDVSADVGQYASDPGSSLVDCRAELSRAARLVIQ